MTPSRPSTPREQPIPLDVRIDPTSDDRYMITVKIKNTEIAQISHSTISNQEASEIKALVDQRATKTETQHHLRLIGQKLHEFVTGGQGEVQDIFAQLLTQYDTRLMINIVMGTDDIINGLPWELLCDENGSFLSLSRRTPIVRSSLHRINIAPKPLHAPMKVLYVEPFLPNHVQISPNMEWNTLHNKLENLLESNMLVFERLSPPSWPNLRRHLRTHDYDIIHFCATTNLVETGRDVGENSDSQTSSIFNDIESLANELGDTSPVRLALLSLEALSRRGLSRIGTHFQEHCTIPLVLVPMHLHSDRYTFIAQLYRELCGMQLIESAMTLARQKIVDIHSSLNWSYPMLYMHSQNGQLFRPLGRPA
ncbi:MAG: hypothetical protein R3E39_01795 [Anaerolineae bacterium]